jgi:shikimate kinase
MKIILLGYMGSGKSTIASLLSEKLQLPFKDLDNCIESTIQNTIPMVFEEKGEIYFRKVEHQVFHDLVVSDESFVLSLGGGTPCYANNHLLIQGKGITSFYLKTSVDTLFQRLKNEKITRPLIANKEDNELKDFIAQHLFERSYFYNHASYTIATDGKSPAKVVSDIQQLLM